MIPDDVEAYLLDLVRSSIDSRTKNGIKRNDFLDILIEMRNKQETGKEDLKPIGNENLPVAQVGKYNQVRSKVIRYLNERSQRLKIGGKISIHFRHPDILIIHFNLIVLCAYIYIEGRCE